jgi:photosystem II stability/assembly factor-like uncharacterized protein
MRKWTISACAALLLLAATARAQTGQAVDPQLYQGLQWRLVGPFAGGRVLAVAGLPSTPNIYYFGSVAGGVWKTTDAGLNWTPMFDREPIASVGSIAVAPSDPNVIYVGTGEACIRGDSSFGDGVYKSTDAGRTWQNVGLRDTRHIGRVIVHPTNPDVVFVAALGHAYGPNEERGVFRSTDGGKSWQKVLYRDDKSGAIDVTFDPNNPRILFATLWQVQRTPWSLVSGGPGSGLYKSTDGGSTWKKVEGNGFATGALGRLGVAVSPADSNRVYALVEAENGGLFRSDDGGENWSRVNGDYDLRGRPWYYTHVFADPGNAEVVYVMTFGFYRSVDGGKTWKTISTPHGDYHDLWLDPSNPQRMIVGNDGGATISLDGGRTWTAEDNQPTAQFYHIATDNQFNYHLYGSQQDRGSVDNPSRTDHGYISGDDWQSVAGGESGYIAVSRADENIIFAGSNYSVVTRFDKRNSQAREVSPWPRGLLNQPAANVKYRLGWTPPIVFSPHDAHTLYVGAQLVLKSADDGMTWEEISPDLTRNDRSKQKSSGGPITQDNTGVEYFDQISTIAESPLQKGLIWVGSDDGLVQVTQDGGKTWKNVTPRDIPEWSDVSLVEPSSHAPGKAYVAVESHRIDDFRPYIYKTSDFGKTWTRVANGIPDRAYVHAVREDPVRPGLLFAGTELGVCVSFDDGASWQSLQMNLPHAPIYDLVVHGNDLAVATHGRSFWVLDDITPLRQANAEIANGEAFLFEPATAFRTAEGRSVFSASFPPAQAGQNPTAGAILDYYLKSKPKQPVTLEIRDAQGRVVQHWTSSSGSGEAAPASREKSLPADAGMNRFAWNLRYRWPEHAQPDEGESFLSGGPMAVPGTYEVKLSVDGKALTRELQVKLDPRVHVSQADLEKQFELSMKVRDKTAQLREVLRQAKDLRGQLSSVSKRLEGQPQYQPAVDSSREFDKKIAAVQDGLTGWKTDPTRYSLNYTPAVDDDLGWLGMEIERADGAPNEPMYRVFEEISASIDAQLAKWRDLSTRELADFNQLMQKHNIAEVSVTPLPADVASK